MSVNTGTTDRVLLNGFHRRYGSAYYVGPTLYWNNPSEVPGTVAGPNNWRTYDRNVTSVSTPNWNKPKSQFVQYAYRKIRVPPFPTEPLFKPPKFIKPTFKIRRTQWTTVWVFDNREKSKKRVLERQAYIEKYYLRRAKYELRVKKWYAKYRDKNWGYGGKRVKLKGSKKIPLTNNPYFKTEVYDSGFSGFYYEIQQCYILQPYGYLILALGDQIYSEVLYNGHFGSGIALPGHPFPSLPYPIDAAHHVSVATDKAVAKVFEKLNEQQVHVGNILAEREQIFKMFSNNFTKLLAFWRSGPKKVIKALFASDGNATKRLGNEYIEYCFGIEPFAKDVYNSVLELAKLFKDEAKSDMVKIHGVGTSEDSNIMVFDNTFYVDTQTMHTRVKVNYVLEYRIDNPVSARLQAFGLLNPAEIAWEMTPWSFVIDWFLPIGNYIKSLTADQGLTFLSGTRTTVITKTTETVRKYKPYKWDLDHGIIRTGNLEAIKRVVTKERVVLSEPPTPRLPRFKSPWSTRHLLLSLSLLRQRSTARY